MSELPGTPDAECEEPGGTGAPPEYFMYVIFHGVFAFYDAPDRDNIDVFVERSVHYDCTAGSYMSEHVVRGPRGVLFLQGVAGATETDGVNRMREHEYLIHCSDRMTPSPDYGTHILLPRPSRIYWDMVIDGVTVDFAMQESKTQSWAHVPIFAYRSNGKPVSLSGTDFIWKPCKDETVPITLHIWASGDMPWDQGGPTAAAELFGEQIHITLPCPFPGYRRDVPKDLERRSYECSWKLTDRFELLRNLGKALHKSREGNTVCVQLPDAQMQLRIPVIKPSACGPVGGG